MSAASGRDGVEEQPARRTRTPAQHGAGAPSLPVRVAIDLETTGLIADQDGIIEVGAVKFAGGEVLATFESYVAPRQPVPYRVQRLTGIRPPDLAGAPRLEELADRLGEFLGDLPLVGHSVPFDAAFLRRAGLARHNPLVDTYELASALLPALPSYTLESVSDALGVASPVHHRALADAELARVVFLALLARLDALEPATLRTLGRLATGGDWTPAYFVRAALRARGAHVPSADGHARGGRLTSSLGEQWVEQLGLDPGVFALAVARAAAEAPVPAPRAPVGADVALGAGGADAPDADAPDADAGAGAPVEADADDGVLEAGAAGAPPGAHSGVTGSPGRGSGAAGALVADCVERGGVALIELDRDAAGLDACLEPLLRRAALGERTLVAVAAAAAARRLARAEIPRLLRRLGLDAEPPEVAVLAEQDTYLCLHRWFGAATVPRDGTLGHEEARGLAKLAVWLGETRTGARDEVAITGHEQVAWERARAGREFTDSIPTCPYRARGLCFAARAEDAARAAPVVVTTHAALAAELIGRERRLPLPERVLILDAHLLEDTLRRAGSWSLERGALRGLLAQLAERGPHGARSGLFHLAAQRRPDAPEAAWLAQVARAQAAADALFAALAQLHTEARHGEDQEVAVRLDAHARHLDAWSDVETGWDGLRARLAALARLAGEIAERAGAAGAGRHAAAADGLVTDLQGLRRALEALCAEVTGGLAGERAGSVCWLRPAHAAPARRGAAAEEPPTVDPPALHASPAEVSHLLAPLVGGARTLVLAGSPLVVAGEPDYACGTLGLPTAEVRTLAIAADRERQTLLLLPEDAAEPNAPAYQRHLHETLIALAAGLGGRLVAIFPGHAALRTAHAGIKQALERRDLLVLAQGLDGSARQLWQTFRTQPRVVLLGAGTFWDGDELVGGAPACVVVARLPFPSLSDPPLAARAEAWQDPQNQFVVPYAALKLRQALNGLAWSHGGRNAVVLFDRRVLARAYGSVLLGTLPRCTVRQERMAQLPEQVAAWVEGAAAATHVGP